MDDFYLYEKIDETRTLFVCPLSKKLYREAGGHGLGGSDGYFICESNESKPNAGFEILAKAASVDAAILIFDAMRKTAIHNRHYSANSE